MLLITYVLLQLGWMNPPNVGSCYANKYSVELGSSDDFYEIVKVRKSSKDETHYLYTFPNEKKFVGKWAYLPPLEWNYVRTHFFVEDYVKVDCPY
jgi:hypothetical protein